ALAGGGGSSRRPAAARRGLATAAALRCTLTLLQQLERAVQGELVGVGVLRQRRVRRAVGDVGTVAALQQLHPGTRLGVRAELAKDLPPPAARRLLLAQQLERLVEAHLEDRRVRGQGSEVTPPLH